MTRRPSLLRSRLSLAVATAAAGVVAATALIVPHGADEPQQAIVTGANPVTPGVFTGLGFDQCQAPAQKAMDAWRRASPFRAVGIYISGDSRACRYQTHLNATWVATQLARGWHLLPIALGPQASCQPRFPRYSDDFRIAANATGDYAKARQQGAAEAVKNATDAGRLGLTKGSTIFYDLEGFDYGKVHCRESALRFLSAWTVKTRQLGYRAGVYSSAGSGMKLLERQRVSPLPNIALPDQIWLARYDGKANTSAPPYLSDAGWVGNRIKQFQGGHNETWGGVTINIDRNYLDLRSAPTPPAAPAPGAQTPAVAPPERHCGGVNVDLPAYVAIKPRSGSYRPAQDQVVALKCLLKERAGYRGKVAAGFGPALQRAVKSWRRARHLRVNAVWTRSLWMQLLTTGQRPFLRPGSASAHVRDLQRALNAAVPSGRLPVHGTLDERTQAVLREWKSRVGLKPGNMVAQSAWARLRAGQF